jgi:hypothetical protein
MGAQQQEAAYYAIRAAYSLAHRGLQSDWFAWLIIGFLFQHPQ